MKNLIPQVIIYSSIAMLIGCTGNNNLSGKNTNIVQNTVQKNNIQAQQKPLSSNNLSWHSIGRSRFSAGGTDNEKIVTTPDGNLYVAYADYTQHNKLVVMSYNSQNQSWNNLGSNPISSADVNNVSLVATFDNNLYIAFTDSSKNNKVVVMTYDKASTSWKTVGGDDISTGKAAFTNIIVDTNNVPYLAYSDLENNSKTKIVTYDKNSNTWKSVGIFATTAKSEFNNMVSSPHY